MWAIDVGTPSAPRLGQRQAAEGALVDEAQLGPVVGEPKHARAGASRRGRRRGSHQQLAAHPEVGEHRVAVARDRQPQVLAAAPGRGDPCARPAGRRSRRGPAEVAAHRRGCRDLDGGDACAGARGRPGRAGRPRPRAARARCQAVGRPTLRRARQGPAQASVAPRGRRGCCPRPARRPAARRPSWCGPRRARARTCRPTCTCARKLLGVVGASSTTEYSGDAEPVLGGDLLQAGLPVQAGAERHGPARAAGRRAGARARVAAVDAAALGRPRRSPPRRCRRGSSPCRGRRWSPRPGRGRRSRRGRACGPPRRARAC